MADKSLVPLSKQDVDALFAVAPNSAQAIIDLYHRVYPNWDAIQSVDGFPQVSRVTHEYLGEQFAALDKRTDPACMAGGLWFNRGFSQRDDVPDWKVRPAPVTLEVNHE
jgi:hypothetical protein